MGSWEAPLTLHGTYPQAGRSRLWRTAGAANLARPGQSFGWSCIGRGPRRTHARPMSAPCPPLELVTLWVSLGSTSLLGHTAEA